MRISKSAIALAVTAAMPAVMLSAKSDAAAKSRLARSVSIDPRHAQPNFKYPVHTHAKTDGVLYDQSGTVTDGFPSQDFESSFDAYDSAGADDFVVSDAAGWSVSGFNIQIGVSQGGDPTSATYDVDVYADTGGLPDAAAACSYSGLAGTVDAQFTSVSLPLPTPCNLAQGTYWVSVVANLDVLVGGQVYWGLSTQNPAPGSHAAWKNPGDGFATGCTSWTDNASCGAGNGLTTALFQVVGSVGADATCTPGGICLEATVGTDLTPGACGSADAIDATVGDQINFCYKVTNNTGIELDYHSFADNVNGQQLEFVHIPIPSGTTFDFSAIRTVSETLTYNSMWTAYDTLPSYVAEVEGGGANCGDRIFADGFGDSASACGSGFVDITQSGTPLGLGDDDSVDLPMPFSINFYGMTSNVITVSNNGGAVFGAPGTPLDYFNSALPAFSAPAMLPLWDDFDSSSGEVYSDVRGSTPNRQFIVEWFDRAHYPANTNGATFELIINEDGTIQFEYADIDYTADNNQLDPPDCTGGLCATIGMQGSFWLFDQFSYAENAVGNGSGIKWSPTSPHVFAGSDSVTVNVGAPQIVVNPSPLVGTVTVGASTTLPFAIENHGNRDLNWSLTEAGPSNQHFAPPGARFAMPLGDPSKSTIARAPFAGAHKPHSNPTVRRPLLGVTAFAANVYDDQFETLDVTADNGTTFVAAAQGTAFALRFLDGDLSKAYGIDKFGSMANTFASVDIVDGTITPIGTATPTADGDGWTGFAQDPTTGTLYASGTTCGSSSHLYTIDRNTGAATLVGELTGMGCAIFIAIGPDGLMYGVDIVNDALYAIDKTTGAASLKGSVGFNANYAQDADFDQSTGILYWAAVNADTFSAEMRTLDLDTGASTLVYSLGGSQISGIATETLGGPCAQPEDLPWLALDPLAGTTAPSAATPVAATVDATNANAGDVLAGTVCATSNDPQHHRLGTPITVNVENAPPPVAPTISKAFSPTQVAPGVTSTLTITLDNTNAAPATLTAALTDTFPAGLVVASPANAQTTCPGNVSAVSGADSVTLDVGAAIPPSATCTVTVDVVAAAPNDYANDIPAGALQTSAGSNAAPADATLVVANVVPTVAKAFAPPSVVAGTTSTLTITLGNANGVPAALTAPLTDTFPNGLVVAATPNAQTTCTLGNVTTAAGTDSVTLDAGAVIPSGASCTVSVDVVAAAPSGYDNTIAVGDLQTSAGNNAVAASATLTVTPIPPTVAKAFNPTSVAAGNPSTLTITLDNANATAANLTAALTDTLPGGLVVAATPNDSTTCGGAVTALTGTASVTLDAGGSSIPAGGSCTITVDVEASVAGVYENDIPIGALQTSLGNNSAPGDATLTVTP